MRRRGARRSLAPTVVAACLALTACGSDGDADRDADAAVASGSSLATVCADAATAVSLPAGWPSSFPLPEGMIVTTAEDRGSGGLVVTGVTPASFADVLSGLQQDLPTAGFTPDDGETEPHDAESDWQSADFEGRWAIRELSDCDGDTAVSLLARAR